MTSEFKITSWEGYKAIRVKTCLGSLYLDGEDVQKLREYLMKDVIAELEQMERRRANIMGLAKNRRLFGYAEAINLLKGGAP